MRPWRNYALVTPHAAYACSLVAHIRCECRRSNLERDAKIIIHFACAGPQLRMSTAAEPPYFQVKPQLPRQKFRRDSLVMQSSFATSRVSWSQQSRSGIISSSLHDVQAVRRDLALCDVTLRSRKQGLAQLQLAVREEETKLETCRSGFSRREWEGT